MARRQVTYPFVPKSTAFLKPGQFWGVQLRDRRFAAGRVMQIGQHEGKRDSRIFLAGLLDWVGQDPPTSDSIAGCRTLAQGMVHVKCVRETGGQILGHRPLQLDGLEPDDFIDAGGGRGVLRLKGSHPIAPASPHDLETLPVLGHWGYSVIQTKANRVFVDGTPLPKPSNIALEVATEVLKRKGTKS